MDLTRVLGPLALFTDKTSTDNHDTFTITLPPHCGTTLLLSHSVTLAGEEATGGYLTVEGYDSTTGYIAWPASLMVDEKTADSATSYIFRVENCKQTMRITLHATDGTHACSYEVHN